MSKRFWVRFLPAMIVSMLAVPVVLADKPAGDAQQAKHFERRSPST